MAFADPNNLTDFSKISVYMNTVTDGWFWTIILMSYAITMFLFLNSFNGETAKNLHSVFLSTFIIGVLLYAGGLITPYILLFVMIMWGLSAWFMRVSRLP